MRKIPYLLFTVLMLFFLSACGDDNNTTVSNETPEYTLKLGGTQPEGSLETDVLNKFKEIVEDKSDNRIKIEVYPSNQLGGQLEQNDAIRSGAQDLTYSSISWIAGNYVEKLNAFSMPYLITKENIEDAWSILDEGEIKETLQDEYNEIGIVNIGYAPIGFRHTTNNTHPIEKSEDYKNLKIRLQNNAVHLKLFETLGANPVGVDFAELYSSLEAGVVDAQENPLTIILDNNFSEVQKYLTLDSHLFDLYGMWMSKKTYDSLPEDLQNILEEAGLEAVKYNRERYFEEEEKALTELKKVMEVNELSQGQIDKFAKEASAVYDWYLKQAEDPKFAEKVWEILGKK